MPKIIKLTSQGSSLAPRQRVAAYARVSKDTEQLLHSLSAQVSYYSDLIQHTPGWAYAGVYVDAGLTGTNTTARPEFQRLIADCEAGKIDIVLTKSISRFARNTVDLLSTVRRLKALGIEVRFEREHINSLTADGELMLSILASFAQEESTSLSRNIKWTVQKKYAQGKVHGHHDTFGYKWVGEELVIEPEQAKIVQFVFDSYIGGMTYGQITKELNRMGIKSLTGKSFPMASVVRMLKNEQYTGCLILQQAYNYEPNKSKLNRGEMPMYRIDGHHPAIISEETFGLAQKIREQRGEAAVVPSSLKSVFSGRVWCGKCGGKAACHRSAESRRDGNANRTYWICNSRNNKRGCDCAIYKDTQLHEAAETLGIHPDQIERFTLFDTRIVITQTNGRTATWKQA